MVKKKMLVGPRKGKSIFGWLVATVDSHYEHQIRGNFIYHQPRLIITVLSLFIFLRSQMYPGWMAVVSQHTLLSTIHESYEYSSLRDCPM